MSTAEPGSVEEKIDQWRAAKRSRDFTTADKIREELRKQGVNPDNKGKGKDGKDGKDSLKGKGKDGKGKDGKGKDGKGSFKPAQRDGGKDDPSSSQSTRGGKGDGDAAGESEKEKPAPELDEEGNPIPKPEGEDGEGTPGSKAEGEEGAEGTDAEATPKEPEKPFVAPKSWSDLTTR